MERHRPWLRVDDEPLPCGDRDARREPVAGHAFVEWARAKLDGIPEDREVAGLAKAIRRPTLEAISEAAAEECGVDVSSLRVKGRKRNEARDLAIYLSRECSGRRHTEIGAHFGGIRPPSVSCACRRVEERMAEDKRWRRRVLRLLQQLRQST